MLIELKICLPPDFLDRLKARELAALAADVSLPQGRESARVAVEFAQGENDPLSYLADNPIGGRRAVVFVSPKLVEHGAEGCRASRVAQKLLESSWQRQVVVGLIGVADEPCDKAIGLDAVISARDLNNGIRDVVQRVARRLWYKVSPPRPEWSDSSGFEWDVDIVRDQDTFRQCLELRHEVYSALGYLEPDIAESQLGIDLDGYDTRAKHFVIVERNSGRVAATARLITPGVLPWLPGPSDAPKYEGWCNALAREEPGRVYRNLLAHRFASALPILDSFAYFNRLSDQQRYAPLVYPQYSCELSRVVVHPGFRGHGLLRLLMEKAIQEARAHRKRYLLLECAPFHQSMYAKFGFNVIEDNGRSHYTRAQRLDSWAVAMHLDLKQEHRIGNGSSVIRVPIDRADRVPLDIAISDPELDDDFIESRLRAPFIASRTPRQLSGSVSKGTYCPLVAGLRLGFSRPDLGLCDALHELHERLPNADVRLLSGSEELRISDPACTDESDCRALLCEVNTWLERLRVTV